MFLTWYRPHGPYGPLLILTSFVVGRYVQVGTANIALCNIEVGNPLEFFRIPAHLLKRAELHNDSYSYSSSSTIPKKQTGTADYFIFQFTSRQLLLSVLREMTTKRK